MSSLKVRLASTAVLLPSAIAAIVLGNWPYTIFMFIVICLAGLEYAQLLKHNGYTISVFLIWVMNCFYLMEVLWGKGRWLAPGIAILAFLSAVWILVRRQIHPYEDHPTSEWAMTLAGGTYIGIGGAYLVRLRTLPDGLWWTLTALPIIWAGESVAYFVGSKWGKHKMSPTISPGKSWEGYVSEVIISIGLGGGLGVLWSTIASTPITINGYKGLLLGGLLSLLTPAGDFFVSMIKREVNVKDSGNLIPGHGGVLDRIDSLLWAGFITWVVAVMLQK